LGKGDPFTIFHGLFGGEADGVGLECDSIVGFPFFRFAGGLTAEKGEKVFLELGFFGKGKCMTGLTISPAGIVFGERAVGKNKISGLAWGGDGYAPGPIPCSDATIGKLKGQCIDEAIVTAILLEIFIVGAGFNPAGRTEKVDGGIDVIDEEKRRGAGKVKVEQDFGSHATAWGEAGELVKEELPAFDHFFPEGDMGRAKAFPMGHAPWDLCLPEAFLKTLPFLPRAAGRVLGKDGFTGFKGGEDNFAMEGVMGGDHKGIHIRILQKFLPVMGQLYLMLIGKVPACPGVPGGHSGQLANIQICDFFGPLVGHIARTDQTDT